VPRVFPRCSWDRQACCSCSCCLVSCWPDPWVQAFLGGRVLLAPFRPGLAASRARDNLGARPDLGTQSEPSLLSHGLTPSRAGLALGRDVSLRLQRDAAALPVRPPRLRPEVDGKPVLHVRRVPVLETETTALLASFACGQRRATMWQEGRGCRKWLAEVESFLAAG
jgi:hypothetical protein